MVPKISLVKISANASHLEHERAAQEFIIAADTAFIKAQGLVMLVPLHKMVFGLLERLLDDWCLLNLDSVEWRHKAEVHQACSGEIGPFGAYQHPSLKALIIAKHIELVWAAKVFLKGQGKLLQSFILESFKGKGKAKALLVDSEQTGAKQAFKLKELVDSNSNKEEEEERVHVIEKIKRKHVEELIGMRKGKEIIELEDLEDEMVVPKTPAAGPLCQTLKPMVLVPSAPKPVSKPIIALVSPAIEVAAGKVTSIATQKTLQGEDTDNKNNNNKDGNDNDDDDDGGKDNDDNSNDDNNAAMDIDSSRCSEGTQPMAPTKVTVTKDTAPVPVPVGLSNKTN
ncbi:hypothetical protein C0995_012786 [Termitomyces sp. Mi166|nr:hypothetical protein C0995_012786 [Termitomyces sp. Mi166\